MTELPGRSIQEMSVWAGIVRTPAALERWTPALGEHNDYVFDELLGLTRARIEELVATKVIC
jgi:crotonobetainyl-CoA:carnitine CoA-transferase CaiB-like acyl-CoA transferase